MAWQQLKLQTTAEYADALNTWLNLLGAYAITLQDAADQPVLEPALNTMPIWSETEITALFDEKIDINKILGFLHEQVGAQAILEHQIEKLSEQDWERAWLKDFHPMQFGKNLWICPSVMQPPEPTAVNIILDPGLAFGTGTHPTTALCLEWLDAHPPQDATVIDYGCGSGILAIAAMKLGAKEVWAIDHDPQALEATQMNAERNQITTAHLHIGLPEQLPALQADVLLANILANPLIELAPHFATHVKPNGYLVLAGILEAQIAEVSNAYKPWFQMPEVDEINGWVRLTFRKIH